MSILKKRVYSIIGLMFLLGTIYGQEASHQLWEEPAIIGTLVVGAFVVIAAVFISIFKLIYLFKWLSDNKRLKNQKYLEETLGILDLESLQILKKKRKETDKSALSEIILSGYSELSGKLNHTLSHVENNRIDDLIEERIEKLSYHLSGVELGSDMKASDPRGIISATTDSPNSPIFDEKQHSNYNLELDRDLSKVVLLYIATATFWLLFGTFIGLLLGVKFVIPELDSLAFLSFGRIRPVHTNSVFWGWSSLAMIGLGYFVVARTSNTKVHSLPLAYAGLVLINLTVLLGTIFLMAGVNNGGGEYREYIWPVMSLFAIGLLCTFINFYKMVGARSTKEIYVSNWYIMAACIWTIVLSVIGYLPFYQEGLGETIIQGYYMHQGVGMWFMTFTLGLMYYFLPSALNKPIYSYALGILAFWTQMLFYTLIGTHHFVFSPLPWWLQTIAIVFSAGMFIPVFAGTTNFLMTMKGNFSLLGKSYFLPFMLIGVLFYFIGSVQGSFQAFRFTNYVWHFTDFNVAHSHMTMYGIISFMMWGCIYALIPKLTGRRPNQLLVGMHFWLSLIGLVVYSFSLMIGGTLKGLMWVEGAPFIESVTVMFPYWLWRAIGGSFMFFGHVIFWFNIHTVYKGWKQSDLVTAKIEEHVSFI